MAIDLHRPKAADTVTTLSATLENHKLLSRAPTSPAKLAEAEAQEAERRKYKAIASLSAALGERYSYDRSCLDRFVVYDAAQRPVIAALRELMPVLGKEVAACKGLIFLGTVGTGKDHLMAAMLFHAAVCFGIKCHWVNGQELYGTMRDRMETGQQEDDLLRTLCEPAVLAISDPIPPTGQPTAWNVSQLYRLLDRRYRMLKSTWVSLNALTVEDADAKLSSPVFDRLQEDAHLFRCFWPSYRERKTK